MDLTPTPAHDSATREIAHKDQREAQGRPPSWTGRLMCPGVLLRITFALTFLVYARTVTFDWVFDDHLQVAMNPWLDSWRSLKLMFTLQSWAFSDFTMPAKFYRPMYLVWLLFFFNDSATTEIYSLSLHDSLPI